MATATGTGDDIPFETAPGPIELRGGSGLFESLDDAEVAALLSDASRHRAERHQVVFCEGERLQHLYLVERGSFKLVRHSEEGKELIVALVAAGETFGTFSHPTEAFALAQSLEDSLFCLIPHAAVRRALVRNPAFALDLLGRAEKLHRNAVRAATRLAFETVPRRLAALLLDASRPDTGGLRFPLNQTELANLIGSSRETVCSILNQFRREGSLAITRGQIRLLDRDALVRVR